MIETRLVTQNTRFKEVNFEFWARLYIKYIFILIIRILEYSSFLDITFSSILRLYKKLAVNIKSFVGSHRQ